MTLAIVVVAVMGLPVFAAPLVIPFLRRRKEDRLLTRLECAGFGAFKEGELVFRKRFDFPEACQCKLMVVCSERLCGGSLVDVEEEYHAISKEQREVAREVKASVRIGILCLYCGHLEKTNDSHLLGRHYRHIRSVAQLDDFLAGRARLVVSVEALSMGRSHSSAAGTSV